MLQIQKIEGLKPQGKFKRKKQIVLCHSSRDGKDYLNALKYRYNGNNPYLPHYFINREGEVFNLIPPDTHSKFLEVESFNKSVVVICLENLGWMKKNPLSGSVIFIIKEYSRKNGETIFFGNLTQKYKLRIFHFSFRKYVSSLIFPRPVLVIM
jgi:N-acetyl-anhydromuramyl-L-alanine amidase AmpD